jgi:hypothetical protein
LITGWHRSMFSHLRWKTPLLLMNEYWGMDLSLRISSWPETLPERAWF